MTMKTGVLLLCMSIFAGAIYAQQPDACAGLEGAGLTQCRSTQQTLRQQERLEQQLQQQQERQNQLDRQQREVQLQLDSMRIQNESLRKQLEQEAAHPPQRPLATAHAKNPYLEIWRSENPWFGSDYGKTQFAMRYMKQLEQERPDLAGRELLDAVSTKVNETFGARH